MKILVDTHTHTNASAHGYSTLYENMCAAKKKGLEMIVMTNHAPAMPDAPHIYHFIMLHKELPNVIEGVKLMKGAELNILNDEGKVDIEDKILEKLDVVIASIHSDLYSKVSGGDHTDTWLKIIDNPYVDILGHSGSVDYLYDIETIVRAAKNANKCIEINNGTFKRRKGNSEKCYEIAKMCKKIGTKITVSSDAHFMDSVGDFDLAVKMLSDIDFPEELIVNINAERFIEYISKKKNKTFDFEEGIC